MEEREIFEINPQNKDDFIHKLQFSLQVQSSSK